MTRFSKHLGTGKEVKIGEETFTLKPLTTDQAPLFFKMIKMSGGEGGFDISKLTEESANAIRDILNYTLQKSFPEDWKENQEEVKSFGMKYMMELLPVILEVNMPEGDTEESKVEQLKERLKQKQ